MGEDHDGEVGKQINESHLVGGRHPRGDNYKEQRI